MAKAFKRGSAQMVIESRDLQQRETAASTTQIPESGRAGDGAISFAGQDDMIPTSASRPEG